MLGQTTSESTPNAISSQESAGGQLLSDLRCGQTIDMFGQLPPPVSPTAKAVPSGKKERLNKMSATYGRMLQGSKESADLQQYLENRLRKQSHSGGLMTCCMILKKMVTPALRPLLRVIASERAIKENGFTSLPRLTAQEGRDWSKASILARLDKGGRVARRICKLSPILRYSQDIVGLNPSFGGWMMGYSPEHINCAPTEMPSIRMSRPDSSQQQFNPEGLS